METKKNLILWMLVALIVSACQNDDFSVEKPNVDKFVSLLKSGEYFEKAGYTLPDFKEKDIDKLLYYIKDTTVLNQFPTNPVSSKLTLPKILCECIFWTIDGIRFGTKYPSLEPCLIDTTNYSIKTGYTRVSSEKLLEISDLYIKWHNDYKKNPTESIKQKNIFENTPYRW